VKRVIARHEAGGGTLVRAPLRAGEVAGLRLDDIDWRAGEITVRGKGNRAERLPLPADAGQAIAAYLGDGRPEPFEGDRRVFLRSGHRTAG
jgi:integrase